MREKFINEVPKWLNPYIKLDIINVDKYCMPSTEQLQADNDVEKENISNQAIEDYTNQGPRVVLLRTKIYECKTCYLCYTTQRDYRLHLVKHAKFDVDNENSYGKYVKRYKCEQCELKFVAESTLRAHAAVHAPFPHACRCGVGFLRAQDLAAHRQLLHPEIKDKLWQPKTSYSGKKAKSEFCIKSEHVTPDSDLIKTKLGVYKPKPKLKHKRVSLDDVKCEEIEVNGKTRYVCPTCNNHYASYTGLQVHNLIHTKEKPYKCNICSKAFSQSSTLTGHKMRHAGITFDCPVCKKALSTKAAVQLHMRVHTGEKPYDCEWCGKAFSDPSAFARHVRTHTGNKPYQCPLCPMRFSDASGLIQHKRRHAGARTYKCEICTKSFYTRYDLSKHVIRMHTQRRDYECHDCGKGFPTKSSLFSHIVIRGVHSGLKCELCPRVFHREALKESHERVHRRVELSDCECHLCGQIFLSKKVIVKHLRLEHS